jgi:RIO kinase 1
MTRDEQPLLLSMLDSFLDSGAIAEVLEFVKGGKEATVFRCRAGNHFVAAKVYRPRKYRNFKDDADYQNGRVIGDARARRAVKNRSTFGREVQQGRWVAAEFETQQMLFAAGVNVPRPIACNGDAILMEWIGDEHAPAPQLKDVRLPENLIRPTFQRILRDVDTLLAHNRIHGDLSPFNILFWHDQPRLIDFPQAVDPRMNHNSYALLYRDVDNVCRHFISRYGLQANATRIAGEMWSSFVRGFS